MFHLNPTLFPLHTSKTTNTHPVCPPPPRLRLRLQLSRQDQELLRLDRPLLLQRERRQLPPAVRHQVRPAGSYFRQEQAQRFRRWWRWWLADDSVYPAAYWRKRRWQHRERKFRPLSGNRKNPYADRTPSALPSGDSVAVQGGKELPAARAGRPARLPTSGTLSACKSWLAEMQAGAGNRLE